MRLAYRLTVISLLAASSAVHAQSPKVGDTISVTNFSLYPQPEVGGESSAQRHALTRSIESMREHCAYRRDEITSLPPELRRTLSDFKVLELANGQRQSTMVNGQVKTEHVTWGRVEHTLRPTCKGWVILDGTAAVDRRTARQVRLGIQTNNSQPPGYFCPPGWDPNPSGVLERGGGFRCFAAGGDNAAIPPGFKCPAGLELKDHGATGLLVCQSR